MVNYRKEVVRQMDRAWLPDVPELCCGASQCMQNAHITSCQVLLTPVSKSSAVPLSSPDPRTGSFSHEAHNLRAVLPLFPPSANWSCNSLSLTLGQCNYSVLDSVMKEKARAQNAPLLALKYTIRKGKYEPEIRVAGRKWIVVHLKKISAAWKVRAVQDFYCSFSDRWGGIVNLTSPSSWSHSERFILQ